MMRKAVIWLANARVILKLLWTLLVHITLYKMSRKYRAAYQAKCGDDPWAWMDR